MCIAKSMHQSIKESLKHGKTHASCLLSLSLPIVSLLAAGPLKKKLAQSEHTKRNAIAGKSCSTHRRVVIHENGHRARALGFKVGAALHIGIGIGIGRYYNTGAKCKRYFIRHWVWCYCESRDARERNIGFVARRNDFARCDPTFCPRRALHYHVVGCIFENEKRWVANCKYNWKSIRDACAHKKISLPHSDMRCDNFLLNFAIPIL